MKAWIIKWGWIGDHAAVSRPLVNVLSARTSPDEVCKYVERCYASQYYSVPEQLALARYNKPAKPPYTAQFDGIDGFAYPGSITCGHNPFIEAFLADGVATSDTGLGVTWDEGSVQRARDKFRKAIARGATT